MQRLQKIVADSGEEAGLEPVGALGGVARRDQLVVGALEPIERGLELLGPDAHLRLEADRRLKQRVGVGLVVHRALDALHQGRVDLGELLVAPLRDRSTASVASTFALAVVELHFALLCRAPNATPVSV